MKNKRGITLIALIITIIVLLILAGVSINAVIGDNGIIANAQMANIKTGVSALEEFLQSKYVEKYNQITDNKALSLERLYPNYFYIPSDNGVGNLLYVVNSDGDALYLIKKSGLPKEIQDMLVGR